MTLSKMTAPESCTNYENIPNIVRKTMETTGLGEYLKPELVCLDIQTEIQIPWSPHSWKVLHLAQMHESQLDWIQSMNLIYEHQKMIYAELRKAQPKYILIEWDNGRLNELMPRIPPKVKEMDINNSLLKKHIYVLWGGFFYALQTPWVMIVNVENPNDSDIPYDKTGEILSKEELTIRRESQKERRESYALWQIRKILSSDPQANIAIVYGAGHDFSRNFQRYFDKTKTPALNRTRFPKAIIERMKLLREIPMSKP